MGGIYSGKKIGSKPIILSTPMAVDVSSTAIKKKTLPKGTTVTYSTIKTSPQGLFTNVNLEKKTLLGG